MILWWLAWLGLETLGGAAALMGQPGMLLGRGQAVPTQFIEPALDAQRHALLAQLDDLCSGSLVTRFKRCGYKSRRCALPRPRPQSIVTTSVAGMTLGRVIPAHALETARAPTAECQRSCKQVAELIAVGDEAYQALAQAAPPLEYQE